MAKNGPSCRFIFVAIIYSYENYFLLSQLFDFNPYQYFIFV